MNLRVRLLSFPFKIKLLLSTIFFNMTLYLHVIVDIVKPPIPFDLFYCWNFWLFENRWNFSFAKLPRLFLIEAAMAMWPASCCELVLFLRSSSCFYFATRSCKFKFLSSLWIRIKAIHDSCSAPIRISHLEISSILLSEEMAVSNYFCHFIINVPICSPSFICKFINDLNEKH